MPSCFVVGCKSGYNSKSAHLFRAPKTADKALWLRNIPKRQNVDFDLSKSVLCDKHFDSSLIKSNQRTIIIINGEEVPLPTRLKLTLVETAVPTLFSNEKLPSYYDKKCSRKAPKERKSDIPTKKEKLIRM